MNPGTDRLFPAGNRLRPNVPLANTKKGNKSKTNQIKSRGCQTTRRRQARSRQNNKKKKITIKTLPGLDEDRNSRTPHHQQQKPIDKHPTASQAPPPAPRTDRAKGIRMEEEAEEGNRRGAHRTARLAPKAIVGASEPHVELRHTQVWRLTKWECDFEEIERLMRCGSSGAAVAIRGHNHPRVSQDSKQGHATPPHSTTHPHKNKKKKYYPPLTPQTQRSGRAWSGLPGPPRQTTAGGRRGHSHARATDQTAAATTRGAAHATPEKRPSKAGEVRAFQCG